MVLTSSLVLEQISQTPKGFNRPRHWQNSLERGGLGNLTHDCSAEALDDGRVAWIGKWLIAFKSWDGFNRTDGCTEYFHVELCAGLCYQKPAPLELCSFGLLCTDGTDGDPIFHGDDGSGTGVKK